MAGKTPGRQAVDWQADWQKGKQADRHVVNSKVGRLAGWQACSQTGN
jgi:hypothetical protein